MTQISTSGIESGSIIEPVHVLRSIDALNGSGSAYDIVISGSLNVSGTMRIATSSIVNVANQAVILAYNTSSGDIYTTNSSSGTSGTSTRATRVQVQIQIYKILTFK